MVKSLGYNCNRNLLQSPEEERERLLVVFWMVYHMDTCFSVRLGRQPMIRDYEVNVPMFSHSAVPQGYADMLIHWIRTGRLHCLAVEQLYSSKNSQHIAAERHMKAESLARSLRQAWDNREMVILHRCGAYCPMSISTKISRTGTFPSNRKQNCYPRFPPPYKTLRSSNAP